VLEDAGVPFERDSLLLDLPVEALELDSA